MAVLLFSPLTANFLYLLHSTLLVQKKIKTLTASVCPLHPREQTAGRKQGYVFPLTTHPPQQNQLFLQVPPFVYLQKNGKHG